jgi:uncharacterized protein YlxW (UPF0749 family)
MNTYYELQDLARTKWMQSQALTDRIEYLHSHNSIDDDRKYELFQRVRALQEQAMELEKKASDAQAEMWRLEYAEETQRQKEWAEQMIDERPQ